MIPEDIARLFERAYDFVYDQALCNLDWSDVFVAVKARQSSFANDRTAYASILPILTGTATGGQVEQAIPLAASWVLYDLASDIFDDLQDQDGKDRPWNHWRPSRAMNVGLGIIAAAQICLARLQALPEVQSDILDSWAHAFALAARGQVSVSGTPSLEQYFSQVVAKSGLIYARVACAGARLNTTNTITLAAMHDYGLALGMIIQIKDDCRDLLAYDLLSDLDTGAYTLPVIYALSQKDDPRYPQFCALLNSPHKLTSEDTETIHQLLTDMGAMTYSFAIAKSYEQKALAALNHFSAEQVFHLSTYVSSFFPS